MTASALGLVALALCARAAADPAWVKQDGQAIIAGNAAFVLRVEQGVVRSLSDAQSADVYADQPFSCRYDYQGRTQRPPTLPVSQKIDQRRGGITLSLAIDCGVLHIEQRLSLPNGDGPLEEALALTNAGVAPLERLDVGFVKDAGAPSSLSAAGPLAHPVALPWGRSLVNPVPGGPDYPLSILSRSLEVSPDGDERLYGSEAWAFSGRRTLLVSRASEEDMDFSVLRLERAGTTVRLRFAGAAPWLGWPAALNPLPPGATVRPTPAQLRVVTGDWKAAFYSFRAELRGRALAAPADYAPPLVWREPVARWRRPTAIDAALRSASAASAQALSLGSGWDVKPGSALWDSARLSGLARFVAKLRRARLVLELDAPLPPVDPGLHSRSSWRLASGERQPAVCAGSRQYLDEQWRRLTALSDAGVRYFWLGSGNYTGSCEDLAHAHHVPYTRQDQLVAIESLIRRLHEAHPEAVIAAGDPLLGPGFQRLAPISYLFGHGGYDEIALDWGDHPLDAVLDGRAKALYYYNLAYEVPLAARVNLAEDEPGLLSFWWYASTCRHLEVTGAPLGRKARTSQRQALKRYRQLQPYFARGLFFGLADDAHSHTAADGRSAALVLFNFSEQPQIRRLEFDGGEIGLRDGQRRVIEESLPARGAAVIVIDDRPAAPRTRRPRAVARAAP